MCVYVYTCARSQDNLIILNVSRLISELIMRDLQFPRGIEDLQATNLRVGVIMKLNSASS